jgi:para-aminobenzoate synthetase component 1
VTINTSLKLVPLELPANIDTTTLFSALAHKPWSMLLDSSNSQHADGRFDIIVADPIISMTTNALKTTITFNSKRSNSAPQPVISQDNPLTLIEKYQSEVFGHVSMSDDIKQSELPFLCGALGFFGYDLGRRFETLPDTAKDDYNTPDMAIGLYSWSVIKDNSAGLWYLAYVDSLPHPEHKQIISWARDTSTESNNVSNFTLKTDWTSNLAEDKYLERVNRIKQYLTKGDCYQVNMTQRFSAQYSGDEWQAYQALRHSNQAPFSAFIKIPRSSIMSVSPERFLSISDGQVETKPIKGTRPRYSDKIQDSSEAQALQYSEKDRAENLMIVDLLRNDISKGCIAGSVEVPSLFKIESFPAVHHLVSKITGRLKTNVSPIALLQGAFPGGSITGAPKIRAMEIIEELEPHKRNIYCGSIGYIGIRQDVDTNICIRTLLCENQTIYCWAGGGIVLDSIPEMEYEESHHKVSKILPTLRQLNA